MLFSVIIPVHNAEQYIDRCLQSIFVNDFEDYEILAVENGSTDNSLAILNSYASEHPQIKVFSTTEKGVSNARNIGLDNATGDIITFIDIDDTVESNYFIEINEIFCTSPEIDAVMFDHNEIMGGKSMRYSNLGKSRTITGLDATKLILTDLGGHPWDKAIKRNKVSHQRFNTQLFICEDLEFETRIFFSLENIFVLASPIYNYWINQASAIKAVNKNSNPLRLSINSATENMLYSYHCISDFFCAAETPLGDIAQLALAIYSDTLANFIISAYIEKQKGKVEQYLPELNRVKRLSNRELRNNHRKKYIRIQIITIILKLKLSRYFAIALLGFNGAIRSIKWRILQFRAEKKFET